MLTLAFVLCGAAGGAAAAMQLLPDPRPGLLRAAFRGGSGVAAEPLGDTAGVEQPRASPATAALSECNGNCVA